MISNKLIIKFFLKRKNRGKTINGQITQHFSWNEARCISGANVPEQYHYNVFKVAGNLELVRLALQCPIIVDKWYTPEKYNEAEIKESVFGFEIGISVLIRTEKFEPLDVWKIMNAMMNLSLITKGGLYLHDNCVHYDIRGEKLIKDFSSDLKLDKFINHKKEKQNGHQ